MTPMLPPAWIMALLHFQVGLKSYVIPKRASRKIEALQKTTASFEDEHFVLLSP